MTKITKTVASLGGPFWTSCSVSYEPIVAPLPKKPRLADKYVELCPSFSMGQRANIAAGLPAIGDVDLTNCQARAAAKSNARYYADPKNRTGKVERCGSFALQTMPSPRRAMISGPWGYLP